MKNTGSFLVGAASTLGVSQMQNLDAASSLPNGLIDSVEALISLLGGIVSTVVVAFLRNKWDKRKEKLKEPKAKE
ncbi:hypothetical protein EYV94_27515 [Puteibacter caeruleilacunae]|nr:hypothetical protein EYV94_27515 [Puteibacter caeruleilacunae]